MGLLRQPLSEEENSVGSGWRGGGGLGGVGVQVGSRGKMKGILGSLTNTRTHTHARARFTPWPTPLAANRNIPMPNVSLK